MDEVTDRVIKSGEYKYVEFERCTFAHGLYILEGCTMSDCTINGAEITFVGVRASSTTISNSIVKFEDCEFSNTDISRSEFGAENSKFAQVTMLSCMAGTAITGVQFQIGTIQLSAMALCEALMVKCDLINMHLSSDIPMRECTKHRCRNIYATRVGGRRYELSVDSDSLIRSGCRSFGRCSDALEHWGREGYKDPQRGRLYVALIEWLEREGIVK